MNTGDKEVMVGIVDEKDFDEFGEYKKGHVLKYTEPDCAADFIDPIDVYTMHEDQDDEYDKYDKYDEFDEYDEYGGYGGYDDSGEYYADDEANERASFSFQRFREDEELYVDDQSCQNCVCRGLRSCPMRIDTNMSNAQREAIKESRKEDADFRNGRLSWCIYWKGQKNDGRDGRDGSYERGYW